MKSPLTRGTSFQRGHSFNGLINQSGGGCVTIICVE